MSSRKRETFLRIADVLSSLGTCDRKRVGALLVKDGRCISWGYNGAPPGLPHCDECRHGYNDFDEERAKYMVQEYGCNMATHAEANAVAFAARQGISTEGSELFVTVSPCIVCARLLIAAGIVEVTFIERYRNEDGLVLLENAGVACFG